MTLKLAATLVAPASSGVGGDWSGPRSSPERLLDPSFYLELARRAERAGVHYVFLPDKYTLHDASRAGLRGAVNVWPEPITLMSALALVTEHIGLAATVSTTYHEPFHLARMFASLDHLSRGRAAWNVVTSLGDMDAHNFAVDHRPPLARRHEHSDEFLGIVRSLWDSWEDGALVVDKDAGVFADPDKIHTLDHEGEWFRVRGPLTVSRPPQGHPVIIQAGASEEFRERAARTADVIFTRLTSIDEARAFGDDLSDRLRRHGRRPEDVLVMPGVNLIVDETDALAARRLRRRFGDAAPPHLVVAGTPESITERLAQWHDAGVVAGFTHIPHVLPGDLEDLTDLVAPQLRRAGLLEPVVRPGTLRTRLGLRRPSGLGQ